VTVLPSPGHTPGNRYVQINSGGERAVIWGDQFIHPAQVAEPDLNIIFDLDRDAAPVMRRDLIERFSADVMPTIACHFEHPGIGRIVRLGDNRFWQGALAPSEQAVNVSGLLRAGSQFVCQVE
jgi:glyoxylase-like metal-dependent hydrolase (beta-lactamase superfamily II)